MRPGSLAEAASRARGGSADDFRRACDELCDSFYEEFPDAARMQARLDPAPAPLGDAEKDAWIGAIGEHLAQRWGLNIPAWTQRPAHFALTTPVFSPPSKALQTLLICESPAAFRSRLIFTFAEPLERARFPKGVARVRMPWDDRATRERIG